MHWALEQEESKLLCLEKGDSGSKDCYWCQIQGAESVSKGVMTGASGEQELWMTPLPAEYSQCIWFTKRQDQPPLYLTLLLTHWQCVVIPPYTDIILNQLFVHRGLPWGLSSKESACNAGDMGSIPGSGRFPGEGNGNLLQYSCLGNLMDRGDWQATVHGGCKQLNST